MKDTRVIVVLSPRDADNLYRLLARVDVDSLKSYMVPLASWRRIHAEVKHAIVKFEVQT